MGGTVMAKKLSKKAKRGIVVAAGLVLAALLGFGAWYFFYIPDRIQPSVTMEAGDTMVSADVFLKEEGHEVSFLTDVSRIDTSVPGEYPVQIASGRYTYDAVLRIEDTTAPTGEAKEVTLWFGEECEALDFIKSANDVTGVTVSFADGGPDFALSGDQEVKLLLTDGSGNETKLSTMIHLLNDTTPPVIEGVQNQTIYVGDTISYKSGVTVTDDMDPDVKLEIDNSQVDLKTEVKYTVTYRAVDAMGNETIVWAEISVEVPDIGLANSEEMEELARKAVSYCVDDSMDDEERLYAMFWWLKCNMDYTGDSNKDSIINEAIRGFKKRSGDCFTYFAMLKAMMEVEGYETMDIERLGGSTRHYWSLVKVDGEWYHIDACPRSERKNKYWYCFLRTDAEVAKFSQNYNGYYDFDTSLYPRTPEDSYNSKYN